jgi:hypothetical protein
MRNSFLLSGVLLASFLAMRCDGGYKGDDDDGDSGQSGESGKGGKGMVGGSAGKSTAAGRGGSAGSATTTGGTGGDSASGGTGGDMTPGGTGGDSASGGTGGDSASGGTGGDDSMGGEPGTGGSTGGTGGDEPGGTGGASAGSGGSSGKGGSAGTGGSAGKGGSAGSGGTGGLSCGTGEGLALTPVRGSAGATGWIGGETNCVGIQGAVQTLNDTSGSTITLDLAELDAGHICVSGHAEQVLGGDFANDWGASIDVQLNNPGTGYAYPYDASTYGVDGFAFTLSGTDVPAEVRSELIVDSAQTQYCKRICASGSQSILVTQAHEECWTGDTGLTPSATSLYYLRFLLPASADGDVTFDFCIDSLAAITNGSSVGNPGTCPEPEPPDPYSCVGYCGTSSPDCYCDSLCVDYPVGCCSDYASVCL